MVAGVGGLLVLMGCNHQTGNHYPLLVELEGVVGKEEVELLMVGLNLVVLEGIVVGQIREEDLV